MKKYNILYIAIIPMCFALFYMNKNLGKASTIFYGFAENKETELSHDKSVLIHKILVTPGQEVSKGQLLIEVKQSTIDFKFDNANLDLQRLETVEQQQKQQILNRIAQLKVKRTTDVEALNIEISALESKIQYNKSLIEDLKSIDIKNDDSANNPNAVKLQALKKNLQIITKPIDIEIDQLQKELASISIPSQVQQEKLKGEIDYYKSEQGKLEILAPSDGLIGNIFCKEGENIAAFTSLLSFYEQTPTIVKGFVHESLLLQVEVGDMLTVSSTLLNDQKTEGQIIGLGSRIVEIPERLRKIPEFKTYGREVLIRIPKNNPFLQKEKVMLNSLDASNSKLYSIVHSFFTKNDKNPEIANVTTSDKNEK